MKPVIFTSLLLSFFITAPIFASDFDSVQTDDSGMESQQVLINYNGGKNYSYIERSDLRRYDNGKYKGLVSREVHSFVIETDKEDGTAFYEGNFYVEEDTKRANISVSDGINDSIESSFKISPDGTLTMITDNGYPSFRSFPSYPGKKIYPGDKWQSKGIRCVDPLYKGVITKIPFFVEYTYVRDEIYNGEEVFLLTARWATRYGSKYYIDFSGDSELTDGFGSHNATIYISKLTGAAIVIRDSVDETFTYKSGDKISFKGTINLFTKYQPSIDTEKLLPVIQKVAGISSENISDNDEYSNNSNYLSSTIAQTDKLTVETTSAGIRLTLPDLQFLPDSAKLLPGETERLNQIAEILAQSGNAFLLVEGHTASIGNERGEMELSKKRAHEVALKLSKRGIDSSRFIVKGSGGHKPIADNSTKEGMAKNRRVEITILQ